MMTIANGKFVFQGKSWLINRANVVSATVGFFFVSSLVFRDSIKVESKTG